jgi:hypothetical protein
MAFQYPLDGAPTSCWGTERPHHAGNLRIAPARVPSPDLCDESLCFRIGRRSAELAPAAEGPVTAHDLPAPADQGRGLHDQQATEELLLPHAQARQQQKQAFSSYQPRPLSELTLEDHHLLSESEDLTVSVIACQAANESSDRSEKQEHHVADHDPRMVLTRSEVKAKKALRCGTDSVQRLAAGP